MSNVLKLRVENKTYEKINALPITAITNEVTLKHGKYEPKIK